MYNEIAIDRINEIIDKEIEVARIINEPQMILGMSQIKLLLNQEVRKQWYKEKEDLK